MPTVTGYTFHSGRLAPRLPSPFRRAWRHHKYSAQQHHSLLYIADMGARFDTAHAEQGGASQDDASSNLTRKYHCAWVSHQATSYHHQIQKWLSFWTSIGQWLGGRSPIRCLVPRSRRTVNRASHPSPCTCAACHLAHLLHQRLSSSVMWLRCPCSCG